mmetsp:Transcript_28730/g.42437  ORF Transcript_28730/g.42437 Transcript_28730/m.42437 type:complete len:209 (+) Transcript_28730:132-758(+)
MSANNRMGIETSLSLSSSSSLMEVSLSFLPRDCDLGAAVGSMSFSSSAAGVIVSVLFWGVLFCEGSGVDASTGCRVGGAVGALVGDGTGVCVELPVGFGTGAVVGSVTFLIVGLHVGCGVGSGTGAATGVGLRVGGGVGCGVVGLRVGCGAGLRVGCGVGTGTGGGVGTSQRRQSRLGFNSRTRVALPYSVSASQASAEAAQIKILPS